MAERILIIEDEDKIARLLELELGYEGYETRRADSGKTGLQLALHEEWNLLLLDIMIPELNGLEVLRRLRQQDAKTPVILLTARGTTPDIVSGLDLGASDYITKPFKIEEVLARIRACIRIASFRPEEGIVSLLENEPLTIGDLSLDVRRRIVTRRGDRIDLTPTEYDLLNHLMNHRNEVCHREQIIQEVWGYEFLGDTNIVDVYIRYLRKKIDYPYPVKLIQTVRGIGYSLQEPAAEKVNPR